MAGALTVLLLSVFMAGSAFAGRTSKKPPADGGKSRGSWSHFGDNDVHSETSPEFVGKGRTLTDEELTRLKVEWMPVTSGRLDPRDRSAQNSTRWHPAQEGEISYEFAVRGRLLLVSADGKTSEPVTWPQPVRIIVERKPDTAPDWVRGHVRTTTATADTMVEKDGTFLAAFSAHAIRRTPGKEVEFRTGLCPGSQKGDTMTWASNTPVLPQSIAKLGINGPPQLSEVQQMINGAPSPGDDYFDPVAMIRAVNALQPLGKDKALAELHWFLEHANPHSASALRVAEDISASNKKCILGIVMLLFESNSPQRHPVPVPLLGSPEPGPKDEARWPLYPFVVVDDVPFCLARGYRLSGLPTSPQQHLKWAEAHGKIRARPLQPASDPVAAVTKFLATPEGRELFGVNCKEYEHGLLLRQAVNALPGLLPAADASWRFYSMGKYDGDADWLECQQKAAALALQWDTVAMRWVAGAK